MIGFDPTDEQQLIAETVRQFAENEIRPHARPSDESGSIPKQILAGAHELGLVTNSLPEACNGLLVIEGLLDAGTPFKRFCAVNTQQINIVIGRGEADIIFRTQGVRF